MAAISWKTGVSGNWSTATDWSGGVVPGAGDTVTIADAGTYTVTIASAAAADALTLNAAGATVADNSVLTIGATLKLTSGQFQLGSGGEISGGALSATGGSFVWNGGTLDGVTYDGVLDLSSDNATLEVSGGLTATGVSGSGLGTINLTGGGTEGAALGAAGNETLDNATLNIGNATAVDTLYLVDPNDTTPTLTLGAHFTIDQTGLLAVIADNTNNANDTVVNDGTIDAGMNGGVFSISSANFTNNGTITISNGDDLVLDPATAFTQGAGGSVSVAAGSELDLGFSLTTAQLAAFANSGTIGIGGVLDNAGATLTVGAGTSEPTMLLGVAGLTGAGEIDGGTIVDEGSGMRFGGGVLSDVAYQGTLDLSAANATVTVNDGFTATGVDGSGSGLINLTGAGAAFYATGNETLDNMTVDLGSTSGSAFYFYDPADATTQLTLGSSFDIVQAGSHANIIGNGFSNDTLTNDGTITAAVSGGSFFITPVGGLTNNGAINVSNSDSLFLDPVTFTQGATGTVTVSSGAVLKLGFALTTAQLLSEFTDNSGVIGIGATLTNTGSTLSTGSGTALPAVQLDSGGEISGGVIVDKGSGVQFLGGVLSDVTYEGTLNLAAAGASVIIVDGLTATGSGGTGAGAIDLSGSGAALDVFGNETLDNATVDLGAGASLDVYDPGDVAPVLTLGGNLAIVQTGNIATIGDAAPTNANDAIVNDGAIKADVASGQLTISVPVFTNDGSITASAGDTVLIQSGTLTNLAGDTLSGGLYEASGSGSTIQFQNATITTDSADIILSGPGSVIDSLDTSTSAKTDIEATLTSIAAAGKLQLLGSRDWTSTNAISNAGALDLAGGTLAVASIANSGLISGYGQITAPIANTGTISVTNSKSLSLVGGGLTNLSGTTLTGGALVVGAAGTLQLADNTSIVTLNGTVDLTGVGSTLQSLNTTTSKEVTLESSLKTIGAQGMLEVLTAGNFSASNAISNSGVLQLGGGTFTAATLTDAAGSTLKGYGDVAAAVTNDGTVSVQGGKTLSLPDGATNLAGTTLTGGAWIVAGGGVLQLANNASISTLDATIELAGAGATVQSLDTSTSKEVGLEATLATIGASGVLEILGSRGYSTSLAVGNSGAIQLNGGTFASGKLTDLGGSSLSGFGTVASVFSDAGTVTASGFALTFSATGDTFAGSLTGGALVFSGGSDALNAGASLTASSWSIAKGATVSVNTSLTASGKVSQSSATTLTIGSSDALTLTGTGSTLAGTIAGSGALAFGAGSATLSSGLALSVAKVSVSGAATSVTVGSSRTYAGTFTESAGTLATGAFTLTLTGAASFGPSAVVTGSGGLALKGATSISGLTIGGTEAVSNTGTVTQSGQLNVTSVSSFTNAAGGVYDISGDSGISKGAPAGSLFTNAGTLAKTSGTGASNLTVNVTDTGAVTVDSGTLGFDGASNSFSGTFGGAGRVSLGAGASSGLSTLDLTGGVTLTNAGKVSQAGVLTMTSGGVINDAGAQWNLTSDNGIALASGGKGGFTNAGTLGETGATGVTHVGVNLTDTGTIAVASGGTLEFDGANNSFSGGIGGPGTVALGAGASSLSTSNLTGAVKLTNAGTVSQSGVLTVTSGTVVNQAGATWNFTSDNGISLAGGGSGSFTNTGTLAKTAGTGVTSIGTDVTDTGAVNVAAGTLQFDGASSTFSGTVSGSGTLAFGAGSSTLSSGLTLSVANVAISGAGTSVTVGSSRTYAGIFTESAGTLATGASTLTLTGAASFGPSAVVSGSGGLDLEGATSISGLTVGGTEAVSNTGTITQTGQLTVGDASTSAARFTNSKGGVYDISGDTGMGQGAAAGSVFTNAGTLAKTSGTAVSQIGVDVTDTGAVAVDSGGTLEFDGANNSFSGTFGGAGTVAISGGTDTLSGLTTSAAQVTLTGATVTLSGAISNSGSVSISGGAATVAAAGATLSGAGSITLSDNAANRIEGATSASKLTVDTTLEGAGKLGAGQLTLVNQAAGVIESVGTNALTIDTGANTITNAGMIEAVGAGGVTINSAVDNTGVLAATDSNMTVNGAVTGAGHAEIGSGVLYFASTSPFVENVDFASGATGTLELADSQGYTGTVSGLSGTGANALDLDDISYSIFDSWSYSGTASSGTLTVTDGSHTANIKLSGDYLGKTFQLNPDGHFGLLVTDPAAPKPVGASKPGGLAPTPAPADLLADAHRLVAAMAAFGPSEGVSFEATNWTPPRAAPALLAAPTHAL